MRRLIPGAAVAALLALSPAAHAGPPTLGPDHPATQTFGSQARIHLAPHGGVARVSQVAIPTVGATPAARATAFLDAHRAALGLSHLRHTPAETQVLPGGLGHVVRFTLAARYAAAGAVDHLDLQDASVVVRLDTTGHVRVVTSDARPFTVPVATVTAEAAIAAVQARYQVAAIGTPRLTLSVPAAHHASLAWRVPVALIPLQAHFFVWVDATTGAVIKDTPAGFDQPVTRLPLRPAAVEVP